MARVETDEDEIRAIAQVPCAGRRRPRQERARFTVSSILEAAVEVIDQLGWTRASTNRIAERAGVSIGSLYQYFPNKEAVLAALVEQHRSTVHEVVEKALVALADPEWPVGASLRRLFDELLRLHRQDPALTRVLSTCVPHLPTEDTGSHRMVMMLEERLAHRPDVNVSDVAAAAHVLATTTEALTRWLAHEAPESVGADRLVDEIVIMLTRYLTGVR